MDRIKDAAMEKINSLLENFLGINDGDLGEYERNLLNCWWALNLWWIFAALQIYDLSSGKSNTMEFAEAIDSSDLESFGFDDMFIFELWGAITDAKSGR